LKSRALILVALLVLMQPLLAAGAGQDILLLYSNDTHGETAPCG
jgi:hypothetical protein